VEGFDRERFEFEGIYLKHNKHLDDTVPPAVA
jgi:hypothetical protein